MDLRSGTFTLILPFWVRGRSAALASATHVCARFKP
jgi:hypothetical protein